MERLGEEIVKNVTEMDATIQLLKAGVEGLRTEYADAQATIAALQARVQELEDDRSAWKEIAQDWSAAAKLAEQPEKFYEGYSAAVMNAMRALLTKARAEFTQRTAELEAAKRERDEWIVKWDEHDHYPKGYVTAQIQLRERVQAELERARGLILALPKVEAVPMTEAGAVNDPNNPKKGM